MSEPQYSPYKQCPTCGAWLDVRAPRCPHCGTMQAAPGGASPGGAAPDATLLAMPQPVFGEPSNSIPIPVQPMQPMQQVPGETSQSIPIPVPSMSQMPAQYQPAQFPSAQYPVKAPRASKSPAMKILIIVLCVLLVAGAAVAAVLLLKKGGNGTSTSGNGGLTVTGTAPSTTPKQPSFLDGQKKLATLTGNTNIIGSINNLAILGTSGSNAGPNPGTGAGIFAIDMASGATVWQGLGGCEIVANKALACGESGNTIEWIDGSTGTTEGNLDLSSIPSQWRYSVATSQGLLVLGFDSLPSQGATTPADIAYFTGPGEPQWITKVEFNYDDSDSARRLPQSFDEAQGLFAWHVIGSTYVLDEQTGYLVNQASTVTMAQVFSNRVVCVNWASVPNGQPAGRQQVNVPGADPVTLVGCDDPSDQMMSLGPGHPDLMILNGDRGVSAFDPTKQDPTQSIWSSPDSSSADAWPFIAGMSWDGESTAYAASQDGRLWAFDINTGKVLWKSNYQTEPGQGVGVSASDGLVSAIPGWYGIPDFPAFTVFRADNGQQIPSLSANYGELNNGVLTDYDPGTDISTVYVPSSGGQSLASPSDMPSCPSGMLPVSWTRFDTGSILVCAGSQFQVVIDDSSHPGVSASGLDFGAGGITVTCSDGTTYRIGAGASVVVTDAGGDSSTHPASESWAPSTGQVAYPKAPAVTQACPVNTWPISLSTWNGGWLLVCGTDSSTPTWLGYSDGTNTGTTTDVTATGSSYCGTIDAGQVCANAAPAMVTLTPQSGNPQQFPVDSNYFPSSGGGGAGQGTGSYGVQVPQQTAADQARYLEQVLQASAQTRASLKATLQDLNNKVATPADIANLQSVANARQQQIAAIDGAPVTAIPDGDALVAELRQALVVSQQTDQLYVTWGQQIANQDWAGANATIDQWRGPATQSDQLKQTFVDNWNTTIAPTYGLSTFTATEI